MYPNIKHSLAIETNGSYSKAVTGIIITLAFTVGLIILGVWEPEQNGIQQENIKIPFVPENKISDESSSEPTSSEDLSEEIVTSSENTEEDFSDAAVSGSSDVLVLEVGSVCDLDTEAGTLEIVDSTNLPTDPLPLCMDQAWLDQWDIQVQSYGGYEYKGGIMVIKQKDIDDQYIKIVIRREGVAEHGYYDYLLGFELCDPSHPIVLESNHVPTIIGDWFCVIPDKELDKRVDLCFVTTWTGCFLPDQEFLVILAHKAMSQK